MYHGILMVLQHLPCSLRVMVHYSKTIANQFLAEVMMFMY